MPSSTIGRAVQQPSSCLNRFSRKTLMQDCSDSGETPIFTGKVNGGCFSAGSGRRGISKHLIVTFIPVEIKLASRVSSALPVKFAPANDEIVFCRIVNDGDFVPRIVPICHGNCTEDRDKDCDCEGLHLLQNDSSAGSPGAWQRVERRARVGVRESHRRTGQGRRIASSALSFS